MAAQTVSGQSAGLKVVAYPGEHKILLAMSLDDGKLDQSSQNLAGFAIWRKISGAAEEILSNRIAFTEGVSDQTTAETRKWYPSDQAPFQKFRWVDVPPQGFDAPISYRIRALYFAGQGTSLKAGPEVSVTVAPAEPQHANFQPAFTRGYIASQAYADTFHNADIRPKGAKAPDFDTKPFEAQYEWLGAGVRTALFDFIADCEKDTTAEINVFAYDLDEPDVIAAICRMGKQGRLRAVLDNAPLHVAKGKGAAPVEVAAAAMIKAAAGEAKVKQGHFDRFQHNKVFIKRDASGKAQRVLFGSMNFSVRGIYVQANNIIVVDDAGVAGMFASAFDEAFSDNVKATPFRANPISKGYMVGSAANTAQLPKFSVALSPHADNSVSLGPMSDRIRKATSSVLFAVMAPSGGGPVLQSLRTIAAKPTVFSYGTVETDSGLAVQSPDGAMGDLTSFAVLQKNIPAPFNQEFSGGPGMHIHDKFVVVDFNGQNPTVFTGSSNLAAGGETQNGDSLAMIEDAGIAGMYAIEAVAMFDHYHFRKAMQTATKPQPLTLWYPGKAGAATPWWKPYYDPTKIQLRDRCLFAGAALPAGVDTTKNVDWDAVDPQGSGGAAKPSPKGGAKAKQAAGARKTARTAAPAKKKAAKSKKKKAAPAKKKASAKRKPAAKKAKRKAPARAKRKGKRKR
jgi:phosphatidylserine/phosphatidylglycerophosphate/cardiolipin synthase-like enzyme